MKLDLSNGTGMDHRFILLSPLGVPVSAAFRQVQINSRRWQDLVADMQLLRGKVYLKDGAISERDLTDDGRYSEAIDEESWHLLILDSHNRVVGCTRYRQHPASTTFDRLQVSSAPIARFGQWREPLRRAVKGELEEALRSGLSYVEVGGWALAESVRGSSDAIRSVLFTFAWSQLIGGSLGLSTATHRNGSASILRRMGGHPLEYGGRALPPYYDPRYKCEMEVIRFDSRLPSTRYEQAINAIRSQIPLMLVVSGENPSRMWNDRRQNRVQVPVAFAEERIGSAA